MSGATQQVRGKSAYGRHAARSASPAVVAGANWSWRDLLIAIGVVAALLWAYWHTLFRLWREWENPNYSAGMLVPIAAIYLLSLERDALARLRPRVAPAGLGLIALALLMRFEALRSLYESIDRASLVVMIAGVTLFLCGWRVFWSVRWLLVFLFLAMPLPGFIHNRIAGPLQDLSTGGTVFVLQTLGFDVDRQGHVLTLNGQQPVGIEEACSGLRMLTAFVIVAAVMAFLIERPAWQRATLVLSSFGVAILCNLVRLCLTAVAFLYLPGGFAEQFVHDMAGMALMMPMAVGFLLLELWVLKQLSTPAAEKAASR
jgi:exosortase